MKFVRSNSGWEVALAQLKSNSLSWVPSHLHFSAISSGRVKSKNGYKGHGILITTPSHLIIFDKNGEEIWNQPLETIPTEGEGLDLQGKDLIRFKFNNDEIDFDTGPKSRKNLVAHLAEAKRESVNAEEINLKLQLAEETKKKMVPANNGLGTEETQLKIAQLTDYGKLVVEELFSKTVRIYQNGYVQVFGMFGGTTAPFEKLLGISSSYKHLGDDGYLTIVTDHNTHSLRVDRWNMNMEETNGAWIRRLNRLVTAGQAVLDSSGTLH